MSTCRVFLRSKYLYFALSLVSFGMESPKRVVRHILHVLHDVDQREAYRGSLCVKRLAALLSPAIVPYIYWQLFVFYYTLSLCVYTMCLCVYVSWTAALAIQISPCILFVGVCV